MKEKINKNAIIASLIVLLIGISMIVIDRTRLHTIDHIWIGVGCSLIASGMMLLLTTIFVDRVRSSPIQNWGLSDIFQTRGRMNDDSDKALFNAEYRVDIIAFGLKSFRTSQEDVVRTLLQRGVNFRIITMDPSSPYLRQREIEEQENEGQIKNTIEQLVKWADIMNKNTKGAIVVKGYSCMTLDFYFRVDDVAYVGPYWYGMGSQQTVSYKYSKGDGFNLYKDYFERLWDDDGLMKTLTKSKRK